MAVLVVGLAFAVVLFLLGNRALDVIVADRVCERTLRGNIADRKLALREKALDRPAVEESEAIPEDLVQRIRAWEDDFAKSDEERAIRVLYSQLRDWDAVRRALPAYGQTRVA